MNFSKLQISFYVCCFFLNSIEIRGQGNSNPHLADPTIFQYQDTYYLYGTLNDSDIEGEGFVVYTSNDLESWERDATKNEGFALKKGDAFGTQGFWAPQVLHYNDRFFMIYTADEQIAIASSKSPLGPFSSESKTAFKAAVKQIDPFIFIDDDGRKYLYHVRLTDGNRIFVAQLEDDLSGIKPSTVIQCISAEEDWENTSRVEWPVAEGPTVFKKDNVYYMIYSANDFRNPDYAVGYATATSPLGPWTKAQTNPILHGKMIEQYGAGHGDLISGQDGVFHYVFHTHFSDEKVHPRKTAIIELSITDQPNNEADIQAIPDSFRFLKK